MEKQNSIIQASMTSLIGLIVLNWVMIQALFAQVPPNPPGQFGPYIGSTIALAVVSLYLVYCHLKIGYISSIIIGLMCLLSSGPQKFFFELHATELIPVIILGTTFSVTLIICSILALKRRIWDSNYRQQFMFYWIALPWDEGCHRSILPWDTQAVLVDCYRYRPTKLKTVDKNSLLIMNAIRPLRKVMWSSTRKRVAPPHSSAESTEAYPPFHPP